MANMIVLYPIKIPEGLYCWQRFPPYEICEHFDNDSGYSMCSLKLGTITDTVKGVLKTRKCLDLERKKAYKWDDGQNDGLGWKKIKGV